MSGINPSFLMYASNSTDSSLLGKSKDNDGLSIKEDLPFSEGVFIFRIDYLIVNLTFLKHPLNLSLSLFECDFLFEIALLFLVNGDNSNALLNEKPEEFC
jgi:hypothetical protein